MVDLNLECSTRAKRAGASAPGNSEAEEEKYPRIKQSRKLFATYRLYEAGIPPQVVSIPGPYLPEGHVGATARDNRLFVEAVLYRYRAGILWRDLPERFGDTIKVHTRFSRWAKSCVWKKIFEMLAADADNEYAMIDSTIERAHQQRNRGSTSVSTLHISRSNFDAFFSLGGPMLH